MKLKICFLLAFCLLAINAKALQPPREGEIARLKAEGSLESHVAQAKAFGNDRIAPNLILKSRQKLSELTGIKLPESETDLAKMLGPQLLNGMPSTGTNNVLILLMEFPDHPQSVDYNTMSNMITGVGNPANYPRESLKSYYIRSSYSNLFIEGTVLPWYEMSKNRAEYAADDAAYNNSANADMIKEIIDAYDSQIDYSKFDNDGDGQVDYLAVFWTGPTGDWASFWWGYQWSLYSQNITRDGVRFYSFSWQWESPSPLVIIHETGHALGLPDYYDYDNSVGPRGGIGGLDMMAGNKGDHNCFSKFMLGWIEPTIITSSYLNLPLKASNSSPEAALIMPGITSTSQAFDEYFMVENRYRIMNDGNNTMPNNGLIIWHVDATPTTPGGSSFAFNNSYTDHKLLRLMEADGLEEIENGGYADAGDYYTTGNTLSKNSTPNTKSYYAVDPLDFTVNNISASGTNMTTDVLLAIPEPAFMSFFGLLLLLLRKLR